MTFFHNIVELAKALWNLFLAYPGLCLFWIALAIICVLAVKRVFKLADEAKGPIILR
ncbi:MAG: hypothetical protein J6N54_01615 [Bacteroidales bacterium]|nr:hypothetical protein [Bacteroidales bacterium]